MFLVSVHLTFQLDAEMTQNDRERVLRSIRDRIKSNHGSKLTCRTDEDVSIAFAFFDSSLSRGESRAASLIEEVEGFSQARLDTQLVQFFEWFEGAFEELPREEIDEEKGIAQIAYDGRKTIRDAMKDNARNSGVSRDIVYNHEDDEDMSIGLQSKLSEDKLREDKLRRTLPTRRYSRT